MQLQFSPNKVSRVSHSSNKLQIKRSLPEIADGLSDIHCSAACASRFECLDVKGLLRALAFKKNFRRCVGGVGQPEASIKHGFVFICGLNEFSFYININKYSSYF